MKKKVLTVLLAALFIMPAAVKSYAVDFGVGLTASYNYWQPCFRDLVDDYEVPPFFMYGLVLSLGFDKLQFTAMINGSEEPAPISDMKIKGSGSQGDYTFTSDAEPERAEIDLNMSYGISERLSMFVGFKFSMFNLRIPEDADMPVVTSPYTLDVDHYGDSRMIHLETCAIGCGVNYSYPLGDAFSLTPGIALNLSRAYIDELMYLEETSPGVLEIEDESLPGGASSYEYTGVGTNMNLTLSYYFDSINTSISFGGRLQVTHFIPQGDAPDLETDYMSGVYAFLMFYF